MESELIQALAAIKDSIDAVAQPRFIDWLTVAMSFVSIVVSGITIWFAVQVPRKIADRQDKIALFEKRFKCYMSIQDVIYFSTCANNETTVDGMKCWFILVLDHVGGYSNQLTRVIIDFKNIERDIMAGELLFQKYNVQLLKEIIGLMNDLLVPLYKPSRIEKGDLLTTEELKVRDQLCIYAKEFEENYIDSMEKEMNLKE